MRAQNLFTIAPHAPFLRTLAKNVLDGTLLSGWDMSDPFSLSDVTIILPTMRSRLALAEIFKDLLGGATLLPNIRTFGDEKTEEAPFLPPFDAPDLPKTISPLKRSLILSSLIEKWMIKNSDNKASASEILMMANSLAELIDAINIEQVSIENIKNIAPENLSSYWQETLKFLDIALKTWPKILSEENRIDQSNLQNQWLLRQANAIEQIYGKKPVIAAGSTGSIAATANLIKAISKLERGTIVLGGLDNSLTKQDFTALLDNKNNPHTHPQYGLAQLLFRLGALPDSFDELAPNINNARTKIVRHSLALANKTANWVQAKKSINSEISSSFEHVEIALANNDEEQARAIALATNNALNLGQSVGIISPDRNLARRIRAELLRFNIKIDDSAGTPLFQTHAGRLVRQIITLCVSDFAPLNLIALLRNYQVRFSLDKGEISSLSNLLEYAILRGSNIGSGLTEIKQLIKDNQQGKVKYANYQLDLLQADNITKLLEKIELALKPLIILLEQKSFNAAQFAANLIKAIKATIKTDDNEQNYSQEMLLIFTWLDELKNLNNFGPSLNRQNIETALSGLMGNISYRTKSQTRPDVAIWGLLEARLQQRDLIIMAGLCETIWPQVADPGPWLSRNMAMSAGLEPPERKQGQAAHDFEMAMGNKKILLTYSKNIGTSPALISRLLRRLLGFIGEEQTAVCYEKGEKWIMQARAIDYVRQPKPATRPTPNPAKNERPKRLSVTEIETLIRSPYDIYAKHILKLKPLDPLAQEPAGRERGNIIHEIFDRFIKQNIDPFSDSAFKELLNIAKEEFAVLSSMPDKQVLWFERFKKIGEEFITFEKAQTLLIKKNNSEVSGSWTFPLGDEKFTLRGAADRINILHDNSAQIIDYKTGAVPKPKEMQDFLSPQLLLEALMLENGAFDKIEPTNVSSLKYIKLSAAPDAFKVSNFSINKHSDIKDTIEEISIRLMRHLEALLFNDNVPMSARILPNFEQRFAGNYDHLARTNEWSIIDFDGEDSNE